MKVKINDRDRIREFVKESRIMCKKYNIYPIMEIDLKTNAGEFVYYELDKLTKEEKKGTY
ncbi:MAG: hypothetical protein KAJ14_12175 [Candidatus Omnitrophica bacterium]|nr:hypothetical protein [Candidatus Omnitrophota bacterium]